MSDAWWSERLGRAARLSERQLQALDRPFGAAAAMCARLRDLRMNAPSQSVLPRIDKEPDDGRFAKRLSGLQPVQTLNEYEAGAVHSY
jgi:hypothetical protein